MIGHRLTLCTAAAAVLVALSAGASAAQRHIDLIAQTPCLEEYRAWHFTFGRPEPFVPPKPFTATQCEQAKALHAVIELELSQEAEETASRTRAEVAAEARAAAQQAQASRQADLAAQERQERAWAAAAAKATAAARAQASKPGVRIGMSPGEVTSSTSWGRPGRVYRSTTELGTVERWHYGGTNWLVFHNGKLTLIEN